MNTLYRFLPYFHISTLYFYLHIIAWGNLWRATTAKEIIMERNAIYLYKASTVGANVLQKEMRCMQWKRAEDPIGNRGKCQHLFEFSGTKFA